MEDLDELRESVDVWAELGIQTAHDDTLLRIRRGHTWDCSKSAARELRARGYRVVAHVILGLPGETAEHWNRTADELAALPPDAVKIHNLHVIRGSGLAREYERNPFPVPDETTYARAVVDFIRRTPESVAIARINTDTPADRLLAPHWSVSKSEFRNMVIRTMAGNGYRQGDLCRKN
jgi:radical SAM protein (TIGR01212 family)